MASPFELQGVIFDMDGVLVDSETLILGATQTMFKEKYGVEVTRDDFSPWIGTGEGNAILQIGKQKGVETKLPDDKEATYDIYLEQIKGRLQALPGSVAFVKAVRARGLPCAVASGADRRKVLANLREIGLEPDLHFDAVVTGSDVTRGKPHPEPFLTAAAKIGVAPGHCLVVEDAVSGVTSAKAAGCWCLALLTSFPREKLAAVGADWIVEDLAHASHDLLSSHREVEGLVEPASPQGVPCDA